MKITRIQKFVTGVTLIITTTSGTLCYADNHVVQTCFIPDTAPMLYKDTVYLITSHDEDIAPSSRFIMHDYQCFSTTDMVNWTHHGAVLDIRKVFAWSGGDANAAQCIYRNGKFYYYVSTANTQGPGGDCRRSVCAEYLCFNEDGSIKPIKLTHEGISGKAKVSEQSAQVKFMEILPLKTRKQTTY